MSDFFFKSSDIDDVKKEKEKGIALIRIYSSTEETQAVILSSFSEKKRTKENDTFSIYLTLSLQNNPRNYL